MKPTREGNEGIVEACESIKNRCLNAGVEYPKHVYVDNCCAVKDAIQSVLPGCLVSLDSRHL